MGTLEVGLITFCITRQPRTYRDKGVRGYGLKAVCLGVKLTRGGVVIVYSGYQLNEI